MSISSKAKNIYKRSLLKLVSTLCIVSMFIQVAQPQPDMQRDMLSEQSSSTNSYNTKKTTACGLGMAAGAVGGALISSIIAHLYRPNSQVQEYLLSQGPLSPNPCLRCVFYAKSAAFGALIGAATYCTIVYQCAT
jgi:hypothetical protein